MLAALAASAVLAFLARPAEPLWEDERTTVLSFALLLIAMVAGIGSLALRETLVRSISSGTLDPSSPQGGAYARRVLHRTWALSVLVAFFGFCVAWVSADALRALYYSLAAAVLLVFHAPRRSTLETLRV